MSKQPWYLNNFLVRFEENKDHLIDKLDLEDEQKEVLKDFFKKYPNQESKIDWNRKDLTFEDFRNLLANEGKSRSQAKKKGLAGLKEGVDYKILDQKPDFVAYQPLTYLGSKTIASNAVPPVKENGAKWCIAYQKTDSYWNNYTARGIKFIFVCTKDTKYALVQYSSAQNFKRECYSFEDNRILCPEDFRYLYDRTLSSEEVERKKKADERKKKADERRKKAAEERKKANTIDLLSKIWLRTKEAFLSKDFPNRELVTNITIPDSVTSIRMYAFRGCKNLTNITIPNSVTCIGYRAFEGCENLTNIIIPDSVIRIGEGAFAYCKNLTNIAIPDSVTRIGDRTFWGCENLENIIIPNSVTSIGEAAFYECKSLTNITIPNSVTRIEDYAFYSCKSPTNITIPNSVTQIGEGAFAHCENLRNITIPNSVIGIGICAFSSCTSLTSITIPNSVTQIGGGAFWSCENLTNIIIPDSVTSIKENTFKCCENLTNITIPDSVISIGAAAFSYCYNLTNITIPNSVMHIGDYVFYNCKKLTIHYQGTKEQWEKVEGTSEIRRPVIFEES